MLESLKQPHLTQCPVVQRMTSSITSFNFLFHSSPSFPLSPITSGSLLFLELRHPPNLALFFPCHSPRNSHDSPPHLLLVFPKMSQAQKDRPPGPDLKLQLSPTRLASVPVLLLTITYCSFNLKRLTEGSLVVQWLRICLSMRGTQV